MAENELEKRYVHLPGEVGIRTFDFKVRAFLASLMYQNGVSEIKVSSDLMNKLFEQKAINIELSPFPGKDGCWRLRIPEFENLFPKEIAPAKQILISEEVVDAEVIEDGDTRPETTV